MLRLTWWWWWWCCCNSHHTAFLLHCIAIINYLILGTNLSLYSPFYLSVIIPLFLFFLFIYCFSFSKDFNSFNLYNFIYFNLFSGIFGIWKLSRLLLVVLDWTFYREWNVKYPLKFQNSSNTFLKFENRQIVLWNCKTLTKYPFVR
jgi:hypothetical protein